MVFPHSYLALLLVAFASLLLGAFWAFTLKPAGKWRFELFGIDFALGVALGAVAIGFTLGTLGEEITFYDNLMIMRKSSLAFLVGFGALVNLGMLFLLGALSVSGMAVMFLGGMSVAAVVSALGMHMVQPLFGALYLAIGSLLLLLAVALISSAHTQRVRQRDTDLLQRAVAAGIKGKIQRNSPAKALLLAVIGGVLVGLAQPVALWAQGRDEIGFGAYSMGALFAAAFVIGTPFFSLFLLNLPVQGEPLSFGAWFRGSARQHLMGLAGGGIWYAGLVALLLVATAAPGSGFGRGLGLALPRASLLVGGAAGLFAYGEFSNSAPAQRQAVLALAAAAAGLVCFGIGRL